MKRGTSRTHAPWRSRADTGIDTSIFEPPPHLPADEVARFRATWEEPRGFIGALRTINNIPVAHRYLATSFAFFLAGGVQALLLRIQLGSPDNTFLDPETYNQIFTMHGTTMMFLFVIPFIEALANYILPLMLGTRDQPFPRLTALSYWTFLFGGLFLYSSFLFGAAPNGGWFAYVPLALPEWSPGLNMDWWDIGLSVAEIAAIGLAAEIIVAVLRTRAAGMSLDRMPLFAWAMLITAFMIIFAFTPLIVGTAMLELDRKHFTSFFRPDAGGSPLLWQHIFWVFGHPEVYIMFVPASGIVSQVVQTFCRRPIVGYPLMVASLIATGFLSFGLWVHHMFTTGLSPAAMGFFTAASLSIAIPSGIQVFSWIATIWTGRTVWRTPMLFVAGFLVIFVIGGLTGVMVAAVPFDAQAHDSHFVVAHFHYVLVGGVVFPLIAGLYYWLPKITGRVLDERIGRLNFWTMFLSFHVAFFPMHIAGLLGMPRRVYTYPAGMGWDLPNLVSTIGAFGFALGIALFIFNFFHSLWRGAPAGADPWGGDTLEWSQTSPPAAAQFQSVPAVRGRHPLWQQADLVADEPAVRKRLAALNWRPIGYRAALVVSVLDGEPLAIVHLPGPTIWPFALSVSFVFLFAGALLDSGPLLLIGLLATGVSVAGWFWPRPEQRQAIEEIGLEAREDRLPLAVSGPLSNGWWGTIVMLLILGTALVTLIASYFYLAHDAAVWPPAPLPGWRLPGLALVCVLGAGTATAWLHPVLRTRAVWLSWVGLAAALALLVVAMFAVWWAFEAFDLRTGETAYASIVFGLIGFQFLLLVITTAMLSAALVWALVAPGDPFGHAIALNTALVTGFTAVAWLLIAATVYIAPGLMGAA